MEEKRKIRMPIGAAVACLLIVALLTVGIVAGALCGLFGIGYLVDFIMILCGKFTDKNGNCIKKK